MVTCRRGLAVPVFVGVKLGPFYTRFSHCQLFLANFDFSCFTLYGFQMEPFVLEKIQLKCTQLSYQVCSILNISSSQIL